MDFSLQHHASFIGSPMLELPTPALTIRKQVIEDNIARLHKDVDDLNIAFRPHVKTLKVCHSSLHTRNNSLSAHSENKSLTNVSHPDTGSDMDAARKEA